MKKIISLLLVLVCISCLTACGVDNKAKKGYNKYVDQLEFSMQNIDWHSRIESCTCVYLKSTNVYYYKVSFGDYTDSVRSSSTTVYFSYYPDLDNIGTYESQKAYELAISLYYDGEDGKIIKIK